MEVSSYKMSCLISQVIYIGEDTGIEWLQYISFLAFIRLYCVDTGRQYENGMRRYS